MITMIESVVYLVIQEFVSSVNYLPSERGRGGIWFSTGGSEADVWILIAQTHISHQGCIYPRPSHKILHEWIV